MLDLANDTIVVDVDDWKDEPRIARSRVPTGELLMQTYVASCWHRRFPDLSATACDKKYNAQFAPLRREQLTHPLCPVCFTPAEIERADKAIAEEEP